MNQALGWTRNIALLTAGQTWQPLGDLFMFSSSSPI